MQDFRIGISVAEGGDKVVAVAARGTYGAPQQVVEPQTALQIAGFMQV